MAYYAWRTNIGEKRKEKLKKGKNILNWWKCADPGMENELVLAYCIEKSNKVEEINTLFPDMRLQKITKNGLSCSGLVSKWHSIAD